MGNQIDIKISTLLDPKGATATVRVLQQVETAAASANKALGGGTTAANAQAAGLQKVAQAGSQVVSAAKQAAQAQQQQATSAAAAAREQAAAAKATAQTAQANAQAASAAARKTSADAASAAALQRVEVGEQRVAQAKLRTAAADNQAQASASRAVAARSGEVVAAARAEQAELRLAQAKERAAKASAGGGSSSGFAKLGEDLSSTAKGLVGIGAAVGAIKGSIELATLAANAEAARASFNNLATSAGVAGPQLLAAIKAAAAGTVSESQLIVSANSAILLAGNSVATKLPELLGIARAAAQATGQDVGFIFDSLVKGIARGSPQIIDNAQITLDAAGAFETYAKSVGKSVDQLTKQDQQQATLNAVLAQGGDLVRRVGVDNESSAAKIQQATAAIEDMKVALGGLLAPAAGQSATGLTRLLQGVQGDLESLREMHNALTQTSAAEATFNATFGNVTGLTALRQGLLQLTDGLISINAPQQAAAQAAAQQAAANQQAAAAAQASAAAHASASDAYVSAASSSSYYVAQAEQALAATQAVTQATTFQAATMYAGGGAYDAYAAAATNGATATRTSAEASAIDAQEKAAQASQTELAGLQAQALADAFLAANPNISASGAASAAAAAGMSPLIARLIEATLRAREAAAAVAAFNAQGGIRAQAVADYRAGERSGGKYSSEDQQRKAADAARALARNKAELAAKAEREAKAAERAARAGRRGGGGAKADPGAVAAGRVGNLAADTAAKRVEIERKAGEKLQDIDRQTQAKLEEIDRKAAERRIELMRHLGQQLAQDAASIDFSNTLDDFDQFQSDMTDAQRAQLAAREKAEADYQQHVAAAAQQTASDASDYDAEYAQAAYEARKKAAERQQQTDEAAAKARADAGAKGQAAVDAVAAAAAQKNQAQLDADLQAAKAEAEARKQASQQQKQDVVAAGEQQKQDVVAAALEQERQLGESAERAAGRIKNASGDATKTVVDGFHDQAKAARDAATAVNAYADAVKNTPALPAAPTSSGGGSTTPSTSGNSAGGGRWLAGYGASAYAAGGGTFVASRPMTITVGDAPDPEMVTVTPLGRKGQTRAGAGWARMAGGGTVVAGTSGGGGGAAVASGGGGGTRAAAPSGATNVIATLDEALQIVIWLDSVAKRNEWNRANTLPQFVERMKLALDSLKAIAELGDLARTPASPIDPAAIQAMVADMVQAITILGSQATPALNTLAQRVSIMANAAGLTADILGKMAAFRKELPTEDGKLAAPIPADYLRDLIAETVEAVNVLSRAFARDVYPASFRKGLDEFVQSAESAITLITNAAELRTKLKDPDTLVPISPGAVSAIADDLATIESIMRARVVVLAEKTADEAKRYYDVAVASVSPLADVASLRKDLREPGALTPIAPGTVASLADDLAQIYNVLRARVVVLSEKTADETRRYLDTASASIGPLKDVADLRLSVAKDGIGAPLDQRAIVALAGDLQSIYTLFRSTVLPTTDKVADETKRYTDTASASISPLKDVIDLRKQVADGLKAPITETQISLLADDVVRVTEVFRRRIRPASEDQANEAKRYSDVASSATSAFKDTLSLTSDLFASYRSPSSSQLNRLATDADRIVSAVERAARVYDKDGLEAAKSYSDALGGTVGAYTDAGKFFEQLQASDTGLDPKRLAGFEHNVATLIASAQRLAAQAGTIPAADLAALTATTSAYTSLTDSFAKLASLPADLPNLPSALPALPSGGSGGGSVTFAEGSIVIYGAPGQNTDQLADAVLAKVQQRLANRR